ncbi:MAG: NAD(P)(+) transhydrogenase (Re/Si-specific) subunit beta [Planctomycetota bacterium]|nr:NAD(P)(+) transhydrogenase (Re/Si-specific) subunit beta [Planctomycetota bacterium]
METALITIAYLTSAVLFILSLRGLSSQETARSGNTYGMLGMAIAIFATVTGSGVDRYLFIAVALIFGALIGRNMAAKVAMTAMPELVALLHSFVGLAAVLVGYATYLAPPKSGAIFETEIFVDVFIGGITFTGSVIAYLKLKGSLSGKPLLLPGRHMLNLAAALAVVGMGYWFTTFDGAEGLVPLAVMTVISFALGAHLVAAIGGADMPVVVSMLNSYSGWTASAAGFMLGNDLLIITGALVGSSGAILSIIMCRAMNRSIVNVIFGGFGTGGGSARSASPAAVTGDVQETDVDEVVERLTNAKSVIVVPGYGMAVARAQHKVQEMTELLRGQGIDIRFGIHPVAGRLPGHMNVLLAEANVPYDIVLEMDELNDDFPSTDVVLVIGANDIVNPSAMTDESSPIYGMPVLEVWKSKFVVMMKRSRGTGYAGVDNPLFVEPCTRMLFGDAGDSMDGIVGALRERAGA